MRESPTYQRILRQGRSELFIAAFIEGFNEGFIEGRVEEARRMLLMLGEDRIGAPDDATRSAVEAIHDVERLERMVLRVYKASDPGWEGLLNTA